ncbi:MAG: endonuclease [Berkelbacteria bacterium GW2011_GWA2_35_9]|uniref:Endonuclease n=1 Tax=Berkelbacteria bacterium GW2011_GWA2_35_9 TaxID=1618333 RepID=A0A0G0D0U0_9BACT|nr:MAG: endonuclease [Berkelbacteria bacterium GW2011_GWA2_35_9]
MYYVYVIKSVGEDWYYVGLTNNVNKRLHQHNLAQSTSTKAHSPFKLIYSKSFTDRMSARDYEKFLKIHSNKEKLIKSLQIAEVAKW